MRLEMWSTKADLKLWSNGSHKETQGRVAVLVQLQAYKKGKKKMQRRQDY